MSGRRGIIEQFAQAAKVSARRKRDQQQCRDYWQRVYGADAERLSRGGVTWVH